MSIGIAITVPNGIALAADTQTTWSKSIEKAKDKQTRNEIELADPIRVPLGWSKMAKKLFSVEINGITYAIVTTGEAQLNLKTMNAVFRSAAKQYTGNGKFSDVSSFLVKHIKNELAVQDSCGINDLRQQPLKICEYILAGYEERDVVKPVIEPHIVFYGIITIDGNQNDSGYFLRWTNLTQQNRYGGCWIGQTLFDPIVPLYRQISIAQSP